MLKGSPTFSTIRTPSSCRVMQAYAKNSRFQHFMGRIPVHVIAARAALIGVVSFGLESYGRLSGVAA
jgi:glucokinase